MWWIGGQRSVVFPAVVALSLMGTVHTWGGGAGEQSYGTGTELVTSLQHVEVVYRSEKPDWVRIFIEQVEPDRVAGKPAPFPSVVNIQLFAMPPRVTKAANKDGFYPALTEVAKKDLSEVVTFKPPLTIVLRRLGSSTGDIETFAMRVSPDDDWVTWNSADPKGSHEAFLRKNIDANFAKGNPALVTIAAWPAGDPSVSH